MVRCSIIVNLNIIRFVSFIYNEQGLYTNIEQKLVNSLHWLLDCETGGLDCRVIIAEYRTRVQCIHMYHLFWNALVHVSYP